MMLSIPFVFVIEWLISLYGVSDIVYPLWRDSACIEYIKKLSDVEHIVRVKSSARLAVKGVVAKVKVITLSQQPLLVCRCVR